MILRLTKTDDEHTQKMGTILWVCKRALETTGFVVSPVLEDYIEVIEPTKKEVPTK